MPRLPRFGLLNQPQHVIQRGNNRCNHFAASSDYEHFLQALRWAAGRYACDVHAYVLMTNHVHLLVSPRTREGLGKMMQSVGSRYVRYFNDAHARTGTLWEGRYHATPVDTERYLLTCYRYIELNPVRAQMTTDPAGYRWSSYGANALGRVDPLVTPHSVYSALGNDAGARREAYRHLFATELDNTDVTAIRDATQYGWALGAEDFRERVAALSERRACRTRRRGAPPASDGV